MIFSAPGLAEELPIRIGSTANLGVLPLIAKNEGIFEENGLKVDYLKFQTGKMTMDALISGDIEIGTLVDSNISFIGYFPNPIKVIASLGVKHDHRLWFMKSSGISEPAHLVGKKIGYVPATTSHIFLARYLASQKIEWSQIKPVILQPPVMESALRSGAVDAVSIWQPWGVGIRNAMKDDVSSFIEKGNLYPCRILLATTSAVIEKKSAQIEKVVSSLYQAQEFYKTKYEATYNYLATEIGAPGDQMAEVLSGFQFLIEPPSEAKRVIQEIGLWIKETQDNFKQSNLPDYNSSFDARFIDPSIPLSADASPQVVTFCRPNNMVSALLYIAESEGFFTQNGLAPRFETATNAKICQDMLLAGQADYMTGAEGPFTYLAASKPPIKILAMLQQNPETSIFARRDRGITKFEDLRGKRIAYLPGTVSYFFLGRIMKKFRIERSAVRLSAMQPPSMPAALVGGAIDAFSMWEPWGARASSDNVVNLTDTDLYQYEALLSGRIEAIAAHPEIPDKILKALLQAEEFINENNDKAFMILSDAITFEKNAFKRLWPGYKHRVRIEQGPIRLMEENFRLLQEDDDNFLNVPIPDFNSFVDRSFLQRVAPERVSF